MAIQEDIPVSTKKLLLDYLVIDNKSSTVKVAYREDVSQVFREFSIGGGDFIPAINWLLVATTAPELQDRIETYLINNGYVTGTQVPD